MADHKQPYPVGVAKIETIGTYGPTTWANVMYGAIGTWDPAHLDDAINLVWARMHNFWDNVWPDHLSDDWEVNTYRIFFRDAEGSLYRQSLADAVAGAAAGDLQDAQVAYLINWTTNDDRKGGKPRQYVPGVPNAAMADSARVDGSARAALNTWINSWLVDNLTATEGTASGLQLVEVSFRNAKTWRDTALAYPIRKGTINPVVATQRRRVDRLRT